MKLAHFPNPGNLTRGPPFSRRHSSLWQGEQHGESAHTHQTETFEEQANADTKQADFAAENRERAAGWGTRIRT